MPHLLIRDGLVRGGFAEVYRGVLTRDPADPPLDVAVHVLRVRYEPGTQAFDGLERDATLLAGLHHPSLIAIHDLISIDGRAALLTERAQGRDLADLLRGRDLPRRVAFEAISQVASALAAAWTTRSHLDGRPLRRVHRGVHPGVIRLTPQGVARLSDFGVVPALDPTAQLGGVSAAHIRYSAPEIIVQRWSDPTPGGHTHESDVFALGCTMFEALTSRRLFGNLSAKEMRELMANESQYRMYINQLLTENRTHLGTDRAAALVRAMVSFRRTERPTAVDVAGRCDLISDGVSGSTIIQWCQTRTWPDPRAVGGPLVGRQIELFEAPLLERQATPSAPVRRTVPPPPMRQVRVAGPRPPVLGEADHPPTASRNASAMVADGPMPYSRDELLALFGTIHGADPEEPDPLPPGVVRNPNRLPQLVRQRIDREGPSRRLPRRATQVVLPPSTAPAPGQPAEASPPPAPPPSPAQAIAVPPSWADDQEDVPTEVVDPKQPRVPQPSAPPDERLRIPTAVPADDEETQRYAPSEAMPPAAVMPEDLADYSQEDTPPPPVYRTFTGHDDLQPPAVGSAPAPAPAPPVVAPPAPAAAAAQAARPLQRSLTPDSAPLRQHAGVVPAPLPDRTSVESSPAPAPMQSHDPPPPPPFAEVPPVPTPPPPPFVQRAPSAPLVPPFGRRPGEIVVPQAIPPDPTMLPRQGPRPLTLFLATFFGLLLGVPTFGLIAATVYYAVQR